MKAEKELVELLGALKERLERAKKEYRKDCEEGYFGSEWSDKVVCLEAEIGIVEWVLGKRESLPHEISQLDVVNV